MLVLAAPLPSWAGASEIASPPEHVVDVRLDFAPVWSLRSDRIWSSGIQEAGLLAIAISLSPQLTLEGDLGFEYRDGILFGGMLRRASTPDAVPWLNVSGAIGPLVIEGYFDTVYLIHAELAAQAHAARHVLLFVAAGPDLSLSNQNGPGDDGEHGWVRGEIALRTRIGVGGTW
jgi:hypothetical protein